MLQKKRMILEAYYFILSGYLENTKQSLKYVILYVNNVTEEKLYDIKPKSFTYIPVNVLSEKCENGYYNRKMYSGLSSSVCKRADENYFYSTHPTHLYLVSYVLWPLLTR